MADWLLRGYEPERDEPGWDDEGALVYLLGVSYARSRAGHRAGAQRAGRRIQGIDQEEVDKQKAFLEAHRPVWAWLLANADVQLLADPVKPWIIEAWLLTSGNVIHAIGCKWTLVEAGIAADAARELLGDRLKRHQVCSLELPMMRAAENAIGIDRPQSWSLDPTYLLTRMGLGRAA